MLECHSYFLESNSHIIITAICQKEVQIMLLIILSGFQTSIHHLFERIRELFLPMPDETDMHLILVDILALQKLFEIGFVDTQQSLTLGDRPLGEIFQRGSPEGNLPNTETLCFANQIFRILGSCFMPFPDLQSVLNRPTAIAIRYDDRMFGQKSLVYIHFFLRIHTFSVTLNGTSSLLTTDDRRLMTKRCSSSVSPLLVVSRKLLVN